MSAPNEGYIRMCALNAMREIQDTSTDGAQPVFMGKPDAINRLKNARYWLNRALEGQN